MHGIGQLAESLYEATFVPICAISVIQLILYPPAASRTQNYPLAHTNWQ
jgi:hypothetical protein